MSHFQTSSLQDDSRLHSCHLHHHCITTVGGHNSYISSLAINGKLLYSGSSDKEIRIWNRDSLSSHVDHECLTDNMVIITGEGAVKSMVISSDKIFSAHQDHKIRAWKVSDHERQQNNLSHFATLPTLGAGTLKLLIPKNHVHVRRHKTSTWVNHLDTVSALALSSDRSLLYSVSWDRTLKIWRTRDFKCLESVANAHDDAINALALSSNGDVYTGSADKKIKIWRKALEGDQDHYLVDTLEKHKSGINVIALSTDENVLYSGASDRSIVVWRKNDGGNMAVVGALRGHTKAILCLTVVSDLVCSGSADETIRIWRGIDKCYFCLGILEGHRGPVKCLALARDSDDASNTSSYRIYSGGLDCDLKVWQIFVPPT